MRPPGFEPGSEAWEASVLTTGLRSRGMAIPLSTNKADPLVPFHFNTTAMFIVARARGLVVMTSPLQGEDRRFNPGRAHFLPRPFMQRSKYSLYHGWMVCPNRTDIAGGRYLLSVLLLPTPGQIHSLFKKTTGFPEDIMIKVVDPAGFEPATFAV